MANPWNAPVPYGGRGDFVPYGDHPEDADGWSSGLFQCWKDVHISAFGCFCSPCLFADNVTRLDEFAFSFTAQCSYFLLSPLLLCSLVAGPQRQELRSKFNLPEDPCNDRIVHCCCSPCALCQEAREIKHRSRVLTAPQLAERLDCLGSPPEVQQIARNHSQGLVLEDWEWDPSRRRVGLPRQGLRGKSSEAPRAAPVTINGLSGRSAARATSKTQSELAASRPSGDAADTQLVEAARGGSGRAP